MPTNGVRTLTTEGFNGSIHEYKGRRLLAYRTSQANSRIRIKENDTITELRLGVASGYDDPRLFTFRGRLHVSFSEVSNAGVRMGYAAMGDDFGTNPDAIFFPQFPTRNADRHEKNWVPFEAPSGLHFVYSISPHVVLRVEGDRVVKVYETPTAFPWSGGHLRGGAPPVLVSGEYWHWFHGCTGAGKDRNYNVGLYTFEAQPPFRITRLAPHPLLWADEKTNPRSHQWCPVIFPAGTLFDGKTWQLSSGVHDVATELREYSHAEARRWLGILDEPCIHRGRAAKASEISQAGLNPVVAHHYCRVGLGLVTDCKQCGKSPKCNAKCAKYDDGAIPFGWQWPDGEQPWETGQWESIVRGDEYRIFGERS